MGSFKYCKNNDKAAQHWADIPLIKEYKKIAEDSKLKKIDYINKNTIQPFINELHELLIQGTIVEQKSFLRSFIKLISINIPLIEINYNIPIETNKAESFTKEVLPIDLSGGPCRTRTCDPLIMSQ